MNIKKSFIFGIFIILLCLGFVLYKYSSLEKFNNKISEQDIRKKIDNINYLLHRNSQLPDRLQYLSL